MKLSFDNFSKLSIWVENMKNFINNREDCSIEYDKTNIQGATELLTIYYEYRKYVKSNKVEFNKLIKLIDINIYNHWICYFISCGVNQWIELWKTVDSVYLTLNKEVFFMDFTFESNRIYYKNQDGKILAEITFPQVEHETFCIDHTFVDSSLKGKGVADKLMTLTIEEVKKRNGKITATCSYAQHWLEKHKIHF